MSFTLPLIVGLLVVLLGLLVGHKDILRFSLARSIAVASVAFRQSIRRRVLLILPPVMIAIIAVNQFQKASDPQDSIRQTTNICLMATGLLATLVLLMAACTSIPREIDSRVIYTIATKPITRLEIILGKVIGFSGVSLLILALMGLFTWGFLKWEDNRLSSPSQSGSVLHAEVYSGPRQLSFLGEAPDAQGRLWLASSSDGQGGTILIPFAFHGSKLFDENGLPGSMTVKLPLKAKPALNASPATSPTNRVPKVLVDFRNTMGSVFIGGRSLFPEGVLLDAPQGGDITFTLTPDTIAKFYSPVQDIMFFICVTGLSDGMLLNYTDNDCKIFTGFQTILEQDPKRQAQYIGPRGKYGFRVRGDSKLGRVALFNFKFPPTRFNEPNVSFELRTEIETDDSEDSDSAQTFENLLNVRFINVKTQKTHDVSLRPESSQAITFSVPASIVEDGEFHAVITSPNPQTWYTFHSESPASLRLILESQTYAWNIAKSLFILWLFLVLVAIISVSSSTFLSWPIAITFTIIVLICRYAYLQLGDLAKPGLGNLIVSDLLGNKAADVSRAVSSTVDALATYLNAISSFLPDISMYRVLEELNQGAAVSSSAIFDALMVTGAFGIPILVIGWISLRYKEVAP